MFLNPYKSIYSSGIWLRTNFHTHAGTGKNTCGAYKVSDVISLYKKAGYNLLSITNHDIFLDVKDYEKKYDIVLLNGFEYSRHPHMLCIGNKELIQGDHQNTINICNEQGGFSILNHPNWQHKGYWSLEQINKLTGYTGIEIYNSVIFRLAGSGLAVDVWDYLLSQGKLVWGFANDDFHRWYDMAKAWNVIYSPNRRHSEIKSSIQQGRFYSSTGLVLQDFRFKNNKIIIKAAAINSYKKNYRYLFIGKKGDVLSDQTGETGSYNMTGNELYVRVQVISEHGAMLWTQPIYKRKLFHRP